MSATSSNISSTSRGETSQLPIPELDSPPSIQDITGISQGGAVPNIVAQDLRGDASNPQISSAASDADIIDTAGNHITTDNKGNKLPLVSVLAKTFKSQWRPTIGKDVTEQQTLIRNTISDIRLYTESDSVIFQPGQKKQAMIIIEELSGYKTILRDLYSVRNELTYESPGADFNAVKEEEKRILFTNSIKPRHTRIINNVSPKIANSITSWESIKSQTVLNPR